MLTRQEYEALGVLPSAIRKANKRAYRRGCAGELSLADWFSFKEKYPRCLRCGGGPVTLDHVIPLGLGGPNTIANLQGLCGDCNQAKDLLIVDYRIKGLLPAGRMGHNE